jgi:hypothetical protein
LYYYAWAITVGSGILVAIKNWVSKKVEVQAIGGVVLKFFIFLDIVN